MLSKDIYFPEYSLGIMPSSVEAYLDLQLIENNNTTKYTILGIELNNIFTVNFAIFNFYLRNLINPFIL